jgi:parallel beta-helix repeat protein
MDGFYASRSMVRDCQASYNTLVGIYAIYGSTVSGCTLANNVQSGIYVYLPNCQIIQNNCYGNNSSANTSHAGIYIDDGNNRVDENHVTGSSYAGIAVQSGYNGNVIIRNTVTGNGANNYVVSASSVVGPLITTTGTITNANPWANFSY